MEINGSAVLFVHQVHPFPVGMDGHMPRFRPFSGRPHKGFLQVVVLRIDGIDFHLPHSMVPALAGYQQPLSVRMEAHLVGMGNVPVAGLAWNEQDLLHRAQTPILFQSQLGDTACFQVGHIQALAVRAHHQMDRIGAIGGNRIHFRQFSVFPHLEGGNFTAVSMDGIEPVLFFIEAQVGRIRAAGYGLDLFPGCPFPAVHRNSLSQGFSFFGGSGTDIGKHDHSSSVIVKRTGRRPE